MMDGTSARLLFKGWIFPAGTSYIVHSMFTEYTDSIGVPLTLYKVQSTEYRVLRVYPLKDRGAFVNQQAPPKDKARFNPVISSAQNINPQPIRSIAPPLPTTRKLQPFGCIIWYYWFWLWLWLCFGCLNSWQPWNLFFLVCFCLFDCFLSIMFMLPALLPYTRAHYSTLEYIL